MFSSIGFFEMALIAGIALMVLGPEKFPEFAKISVKTFRDFRKYMADTQREIATELNPMKDELDKLKKVDVEGYVDKLIGNDDSKTTHDDDDENFEYNVEPDSSVIDDWYPEGDHIIAGDDETADMDEDSAQEYQSTETIPYQDSPSNEHEEALEDELETVVPEFDDDNDFSSREEVVNTENPEHQEN